MNLTPEEKAVGRENYYEAVGSYDHLHRRDFMKNVVGASVATGVGLGAMYFNYGTVKDPVRVGVIGTGDEGSVLIGACNPDYVQVKAIADIRPSSVHRAFHGDWASPAANDARPGLMQVYGWKTEDEARENVKVFDQTNGGYKALLEDKDIEAVIIALPLHLHAPVAIEAMMAGKHVLTEKLMAHSIGQCKAMSLVAEHQDLHLATGHQRHYSILYDNAKNLLRWGLLGEIHHIRAQWHRGNLPGRDSWAQPVPGGLTVGDKKIDSIVDRLVALKKKKDSMDKAIAAGRSVSGKDYDLVSKQIAQWTAWDQDQTVKAEEHGYIGRSKEKDGYVRDVTPLEELVRWRLWERTGGGLMAELGSHQLDAASIFIASLPRPSGVDHHVHPLSVHAVGGRHIFPLDRDAADHVYCMFEFPGQGYDPGFKPGYDDKATGYPGKDGIPSYEKDPNKRIVVTYSSINGNGYGGYGEVVMGSKGTLVLEKEKEVMVYARSSTSSKVSVKEGEGGPTMDTQASGDMAPAAMTSEPKKVSRGYREEIEHWAYCIRNQAPDGPKPRCHPEVAVADACIALTANVAMKRASAGDGGYVHFEDDWFDIHKAGTPDGSSVSDELKKMVAGPEADKVIERIKE